MTINQLLTALEQADLALVWGADAPKLRGPSAALTPALWESLAIHREALALQLRPDACRRIVLLTGDARDGPIERVLCWPDRGKEHDALRKQSDLFAGRLLAVEWLTPVCKSREKPEWRRFLWRKQPCEAASSV